MSEAKETKGLPKNAAGQLSYEPFDANGHKYVFTKPGDPVGIKRWGEYEKMKIVFGTGQTFAGIVAAFEQIVSLAGEDKKFSEIRTELILLADSYKKSILDMSRDRYNKAFYLCTLFVYREDDDPNEWTEGKAETYIQDWVAEGLSEQDFFLFAMQLTPSYSSAFQRLSAEAAAQEEKLSVVTGSTAAGTNF